MALIKKYWISLAVVALVLAKFFFILWQFRAGGFLVAPGGDWYNHILYAENLDKIFPNFAYPPLFHYFLRLATNQFWDGDYLQAVKAMAPYFLISPVIMVYFLGKHLFSKKVGLWALVLAVFASGYPLLNFADGSYPDLINYGIFVPLAFIFFILSLKSGRSIDIILSGIFVTISFLTHHLSSVVLLGVLVVYILILIIDRKFHYLLTDKKNLHKLFIYYGIFLFVWLVVLKFTFGPLLWIALKNLLLSGIAPVNHIYASRPFEYSEINVIIRPLIEFFGLTGLVLILADFRKKPAEKLLIFIWILVIWILSQGRWSGLPPRFLRELEFPLLISAGYFINFIFSLAKSNLKKIIIAGLVGYVIVINSVQIFTPPFSLPDGFYPWVWYRQIDQKKYDYIITQIAPKSVVFTNPSNPYLNYKLSKKISLNVLSASSVPICQRDPSQTEEISNGFCQEAQRQAINALLDKADYIFIGQKPYNIDELTFSEFNGFTEVTRYMKLYEHGKLLKQFSDSSKLYKVD